MTLGFLPQITVARAQNFQKLDLFAGETSTLDLFQRRLQGFERTKANLDRDQDEILRLTEAVTGDLEEVVAGLRSDFRSAATNCLIGALKNARRLQDVVGKLPAGSLRNKLTRVLKTKKAQKIFDHAEALGELAETTKEKVEATQEALDELQAQVERAETFLETQEKEGLVEALRQDIQAVVGEEVQNIIRVDLEQPLNEIMVDAFLELSGEVPALAPFQGVFQTVADVTRKAVQVYGQNLQLDNIEDFRENLNIQIRRFEFDKQKFRETGMHKQLRAILQRAIDDMRAFPRQDTKALDRFDFRGLTRRVSTLLGIDFSRANLVFPGTPLPEMQRTLAEEFLAIKKALVALEIQREKEQLEEAKARLQARVAVLKAQGLRPTGKSYFESRLGMLLRLPEGGSSPVQAFRTRRSPRGLSLDSLTRDLVGHPMGYLVKAEANLVSQYEAPTSFEGRPRCSAWRGRFFQDEGARDRKSSLEFEGPFELRGDQIVASSVGEGQVEFRTQNRGPSKPLSRQISFTFDVRECTQSERTGRRSCRTVTKNESLSCRTSDPDIVDGPTSRQALESFAFDRIEFRDQLGVLTPDPKDYEPVIQATAFFRGPEGEFSQKVPMVAPGARAAGLVVQALDPKPEDVGQQRFQVLVQDRDGKVYAQVQFKRNFYRFKTQMMGSHQRLPTQSGDAFAVYGRGSYKIQTDGPFAAEQWKFRWVRDADPRVKSQDRYGDQAVLQIEALEDEPRRVSSFSPEFTHRESGRTLSSLGVEVPRLRLLVYPPRIQSLELHRVNSFRDPTGLQISSGIRLFTGVNNAVGQASRRSQPTVFVKAVFRGEFGQVRDLKARFRTRLPSILKLTSQGALRTSQNADSMSFQAEGQVVRGSLQVLHPALWTKAETAHHLHPDFQLSPSEVDISSLAFRLARTVDFKTRRPAMQAILAGTAKADLLKVRWPLGDGSKKDAGLSPFQGRSVASMQDLGSLAQAGEVELVNAQEIPVVSLRLRPFSRREAQATVPRPRLERLVTPRQYETGQESLLVALIQDLDTFGAISTRCNWSVDTPGGSFRDGPSTVPSFDRELQRFRCQNRIFFDPKVSPAGRPRVEVTLTQEGR